jgi:hypothetical protein
MTSEEAFEKWLEEWVSPDHLSPSELAAKAWQARLYATGRLDRNVMHGG